LDFEEEEKKVVDLDAILSLLEVWMKLNDSLNIDLAITNLFE